jgi:hypothetical protein
MLKHINNQMADVTVCFDLFIDLLKKKEKKRDIFSLTC